MTDVDTSDEEDFYDEEEGGEADVSATTDSDAGWASLPSGEALLEADLDELMRWKPVFLVALVGERGSGKTTFISSIFERFMRGPFAQRLFAGSWTLLGLDQRSFEARAESNRETPDTVRTSRLEGLRFLHLATAPEISPADDHHLILSDRSGETYTEVRNDKENAHSLLEVAKADRVGILLDGGRFAQPRLRAEAVASVRGLIRSLIEATAIGNDTKVDVITTKLDLINKANGIAALDGVETALRTQFTSQLNELKFWRVAARDPTGELEAAAGIAALVSAWTAPTPHPAILASPPPMKSPMDRLLASTVFEDLDS